MLELIKINGGYGKNHIINDINIRFESNMISSVIGTNGCGKSTLLQICCGLLKPFSGNVYINGNDTSEMKHIELAKKISYLPQVHTIGNISVKALVSHGRFPYLGYPRTYTDNDRRKIEEAMQIAEVSDISDRSVSELSGGQQQRVYIAMMLAQDTDIILMDEPITYLDIGHQLELMELAVKLKNAGKTVVMVLHDINMTLTYSDFVAVMKNGKIIESGTPEKVVSSGAIEKAFGIQILSDKIWS